MSLRIALTTRFLRGIWFNFRRFRWLVGRWRGRPWGRCDGEAWRAIGPRMFAHRTVLARDADGHRFRVRLAQWMDLTSLIGRPEEAGVERIVKSLPCGGTFIDAGAHIGRYSLMAGDRVGPSGRVIAIEPSPNNYALLCEQVILNGMKWIKPVQVALGKEDGWADLVAGSDHATNSLSDDWLRNLEGDATTANRSRQKVEMRSLPSLLAEFGLDKVDLLKIDVEGAEMDVLKGAEPLLKRGAIDQIVCEVHEPTVLRKDVARFLKRCGYTIADGGEELHAQWRERPAAEAARPQLAPFRVGIVGCGAIAQMAHIPACKLLDRVRLVGLVDTDLGQARKLAAEHEVPMAAPALDDLFDKVDAVILATPPHVRAKLTQHALARGLHVLCEKPMANSAEECRRMLAQAQQANRTLAIAHTYRFFRNRAYARALYQAGQFGRLLSARVDQGDPYSWPTRTAYTLRKEWVLGGVLFNEGVHIVDMLFWWFGAPECFNYADDSLGGLESNVRLMLQYPKGATVNFRLSRTCSLANRVEMRFENARITFPIYNMSDLDLTVGESDPVHVSVHQKPWDFEEVAAAQLADFTLTATQGLPSQIPGEAGLAVVEFIEACYESKARRPRPEQMPLPGFTW